MAGEIIRNTRSVCPVCLRNLPAALRREEDGAVWLDKSCPAHGAFSVPVWRGRLDFASWIGEAEALGADAIVCVRYSSASIMQNAAEVMVYGTAVKFR